MRSTKNLIVRMIHQVCAQARSVLPHGKASLSPGQNLWSSHHFAEPCKIDSLIPALKNPWCDCWKLKGIATGFSADKAHGLAIEVLERMGRLLARHRNFAT